MVLRPLHGEVNTVEAGTTRTLTRLGETQQVSPPQTRIGMVGFQVQSSTNLRDLELEYFRCAMRESESTPRTVDREAEIDEMRRLYLDEGLTLKEIGVRFGITRQAVQLRFVKAGISRRSHYSQNFRNANEQRSDRIHRLLDDRRKEIVKMYDDEKVPLSQIADRMGISHGAIRKFLIACGIEIRSTDSFRTFPELGKLKVGESLLLPRPVRKGSPHLTYYKMAKTYNIRVSVRTFDERTFRVTRIK